MRDLFIQTLGMSRWTRFCCTQKRAMTRYDRRSSQFSHSFYCGAQSQLNSGKCFFRLYTLCCTEELVYPLYSILLARHNVVYFLEVIFNKHKGPQWWLSGPFFMQVFYVKREKNSWKIKAHTHHFTFTFYAATAAEFELKYFMLLFRVMIESDECSEWVSDSEDISR